MNFKAQFESHPVVYGLTIMAAAFVAGFGARGYFPPSIGVSAPIIHCNAEGVADITRAHNERMQLLQKELSAMEAEAIDMGNLESDQRLYIGSAERIRKDVAQESIEFETAVTSLSKQCSK